MALTGNGYMKDWQLLVGIVASPSRLVVSLGTPTPRTLLDLGIRPVLKIRGNKNQRSTS